MKLPANRKYSAASTARQVPQFIHAYVDSATLAILRSSGLDAFCVYSKVMRPFKAHFDDPHDELDAALWPHGGPVVVFDVIAEADGTAIWGAWREYGAPYPERARAFAIGCEQQTALTPELYDLANRPRGGGIFYSPEHISAKSADNMRARGIRAITIEEFATKILCSPAFVKGGPNSASEDKLIISYGLHDNFKAMAARDAKSRNPGSQTFYFCGCKDKCFHPRIVARTFGEGHRFKLSSRDGSKRLKFLDLNQFTSALGEEIEFNWPGLALTPRNARDAFRHIDNIFAQWVSLRDKWRSYDLRIHPERMFSGASLAKAWLNRCGVRPFRSLNPDIDAEILSKFRAAFYGPRFEARIVGHAARVIYCDATSQYPAISSLLGLAKFIAAKKIRVIRNNVLPPIFDNLTLDDLFAPATWRHLNGIALVEPDNDILPIATNDGLAVETIARAPAYWVTFSDIAASRILTGRLPKVIETLELVAEGEQDDIVNHPFPGNVPVDWHRDDKDIFVQLVEAKKSGVPISKPAINSLAFGLFGQINETAGSFKGRLDIWCAGICKSRSTNQDGNGKILFAAETPGEFNAPWAALITGGGRLMLAMAEALCRKHGLTYAMTNTDAVGFVLPEDEAAIQAGRLVTPRRARNYAEFARKVDAIRAEFQRLSPYDQKIDFFKLEFPEPGSKSPVYIYQIRTGRYVLFSWDAGGIVIQKIAEAGAHNLPEDDLDLPPIKGVTASPDVMENDLPVLIWAWSVLLKAALIDRETVILAHTLPDAVLRKAKILEDEKYASNGRSLADQLREYFTHIPKINERKSVIVGRRFLMFKDRYDTDNLSDPVFELRENQIVRNKDFSFDDSALWVKRMKALREWQRVHNREIAAPPQAFSRECNVAGSVAGSVAGKPRPQAERNRRLSAAGLRRLDFLMTVRGAIALDHGLDAANDEIASFFEAGPSESVKEAGSGFVPTPRIVSRAEKLENGRKREREKKRAAKEKNREKERLRKREWRARRTPEQIAKDKARRTSENARQKDRERKRAARAKMKTTASMRTDMHA